MKNEALTYRDLALTAYGQMKRFVDHIANFKNTPEANLKTTMLLAEFMKSTDYMERAIGVLDDQEAREFVKQVERDLNDRKGDGK